MSASSTTLTHRLSLTHNFLVKQSKLKPKIAVILGSGFGKIAEALERQSEVPYKDIPHFPVTSVAGHKGRLLFGRLHGKVVLIFDGRVHFYEGLTMQQVAYPVYVAKRLGVTHLIATNAAGAINAQFAPGDIMLIRDHINLTGDSPLRGPNIPELGVRFPNMRGAYDEMLIELAQDVAVRAGMRLRQGVYAAVAGPTYETHAELRMLQILGADAVGMSTVPEVIAARHAGVRVLGLSVIANEASPERTTEGLPLDHATVQDVVARSAPRVRTLVEGVIEGIKT